MWISKSLSLNTVWFDSAFNSELKGAVDTAIMPGNIALPGEKQAPANSDSNRDLSQLASECELVSITPWSNGAATGNKQNMNWVLSATDAQEILAQQLKLFPWDGAVCFMVLADNASLFAFALDGLKQALPLHSVIQAYEQAKKLSEHEKEKTFVPGIKLDERQRSQFDALGYETQAAMQNLSISQAIASDTDPATMLGDFRSKRSQRLADIQATLSDHASQGGSIDYVLNLTGPDLADEVSKTTPPNDHAPYSCLFCLGGSNDQLAPIREALSL